MDQRISLITLGVRDLDVSRRFYVDGLGWSSAIDVPDDVLMIQTGTHLLLSLWNIAHMEAEIGPTVAGTGLVPITLAHNCADREEVDAVLAAAAAAGADPVHEAVEREWGGYTGYFADPDGYRWEVAWNPGVVADIVLP